ncbi:hypothetical protein [Mesorhizobium sp.]|uniref:hypothetical protein n=1 Tax=Mesorhizobium sp. TaxID=1871066 RepID=UPI001213E00C|nr:hypothetical protein [Mesorhizobium sp.]TIL46567.1 MAG: hypothetical protein E5Y86_06375 [Mesorhizobium sp.]
MRKSLRCIAHPFTGPHQLRFLPEAKRFRPSRPASHRSGDLHARPAVAGSPASQLCGARFARFELDISYEGHISRVTSAMDEALEQSERSERALDRGLNA